MRIGDFRKFKWQGMYRVLIASWTTTKYMTVVPDGMNRDLEQTSQREAKSSLEVLLWLLSRFRGDAIHPLASLAWRLPEFAQMAT